MRRSRRFGGRATLAAGALVTAVLLAGCGGTSGQGFAEQACSHVKRSVQDYTDSIKPGTSAATAIQLQREAQGELRAALPLAASANSKDGSWNSLMTTISEGATIDEGHLIPALKAQCVVANTNLNVNPLGSTGA